MERKTKQRIIGGLVLIGFVIIMLPFFQSSKDIPSEPTVVPAPPFPEQAMQTTPQDVNETHPPLSTEANKATSPDEPVKEVNPQVDDLMGVNKPGIVQKDTTLSPTEQAAVVATNDSAKPVVEEKHIAPSSKGNKNHTKTAKIQKNKVENDGLAKLPEAAWVIQIGSFKNKANAIQLVNQLRAHGYKAFIQQVSTSLGESTRVFVGPEEKHATARALVAKIKNELQLDGIVISYKPLAL